MNKGIFGVLALFTMASLVSASCMFDTTFGAVRCYDNMGKNVPIPPKTSFGVAYVGITILPNGVNNVTKPIPSHSVATASIGLTILPRPVEAAKETPVQPVSRSTSTATASIGITILPRQ